MAEDFTFVNLKRVAQAYADYLLQELETKKQSLIQQFVVVGQISQAEAETDMFRNVIGKSFESQIENASLVIVGFDRRFLSEKFAARAAEVLAGNGLRVALFEKDIPTPVVSWAVKKNNALGGVVITASHNPPDFNGFKIKAPWGGSASPEITSAVESLLDANALLRRANVTTAN